MSIQHGNMNQQITKERVDQILTQETRVARNMEKDTQGYDRQFYSVEQTRQDMKLIDQVLHVPPVELRLEDSKKYRLQAIQGRNLSHVLLNSKKTSGDSEEMTNVKNSIESLEQQLAQVQEDSTSVANIEKVEDAYLLAISHCQYYCDNKNPTFQTGKERKQLVMDTLAQLRREAGWLAEAKKRIQAGEQFADAHSVRDLLEKGQETGERSKETRSEGSINALTYNDFVAVLGTHNRGQVEFSGGELKIINNGMLSRSKGEASLQNYLVRQRFFSIAMQRLGGELTPELFERMRTTLGVDMTAEKALPLSRQAIHDVIALVNMRSSVVARTLHRGSKADPIKYALAKKANGMIGAKANAYERSFTTSEREKQFKEEINSLLARAREYDKDKTIPELTTRQMDRLVKGNLSLLRDQIYAALSSCRTQIVHLTGGRDNGLEMVEQGYTSDYSIAARVIHLVAATTEAGRAVAEYELEKKVTDVALAFTKNLKASYDKTRFTDLSSGGSGGLQEEVEARLAKNSTLQSDLKKTRLGTEGLKELCEKLQQLDEWQSKGLHEGLSVEEASQMVALATELDRLTTSYRNRAQVEAIRHVAAQLEGTRFAKGLEALDRVIEKDNFSFSREVKKLADGMTCPAELLQRERQQEEPEPEEQEQMTSRNIRYELDMLEPEARKIASVFLLADSPSAFLKKKSTAQLREYRQLHQTLRDFAAARGDIEKEIRMSGVSLKLHQKDSQILQLEIDGKMLTLPANAAIIADSLETDVIGHEEVYGRQRAKEIIDGLEPDEENMADWIRSRKLCLKVLTQKTGKPSDFFNNVPAKQVQTYASNLLAGRMTADAVVTNIEKIENKARINGDETLELLKMNAKMKEQEKELGINGVRVHMPRREVRKRQSGEQQNANEWSGEEEAVKALVSDLIFSQETWKADNTMEQPGMRVKLMLEKHVDTLVQIVRNPGQIDAMLLRMPFPGDAEVQQKMRNIVHDSLEKIVGSFVFQKAAAHMTDKQIRGVILLALQTRAVQGNLEDIDSQIDTMVKDNIEAMQSKISESVSTVFGGGETDKKAPNLLDDTRAEDELKGVIEQLRPFYEKLKTVKREKLPEEEQKKLAELEDKRKQLTQESVGKLNKIMQQSAQGSSGQGKFIRIVLENYFKEVPLMDQRAMFASALRNAKPHVEPAADTTEAEKQAREEQELGNYLSGVLKGAGPLLQKMLQGLPLEAMPEMLKGALKDMKSNLAPIPDEIVQAQLQGMVERSHGKVTRMEVTRALGAASVGQAFMCRIYGPGMPEEGNEVVVKLLRPDVRNRMERERQIMIHCADQTDENHGMKATYEGQLLRISEELDLSFEAQNVEMGKVYDKKTTMVQSMKVNPLIEPTVNALALEKAPGTTIDKYMDELHQMKNEMMNSLYEHNADGSVKMVREGNKTYPKLNVAPEQMYKIKMDRDTLAKKLEQLTKRQVYLADLVEQWVTEGIFGQGFYHGDLHAGNMLIDDDGLTVIDFGNATTLTEKQQAELTRMVAAAAYGFADDFQKGLHNLLEHTSEKLYKEKEKDLRETLTKVFRMGNQESAGQRIAVALLKAQELGIEVPSSIFNFSQCQIRLQNALDEMNDLIEDMRQDLDALNAVAEKRAVGYLMNDKLSAKQANGAILSLADRERFIAEADFTEAARKAPFMSRYLTPLKQMTFMADFIKNNLGPMGDAMVKAKQTQLLEDGLESNLKDLGMYMSREAKEYIDNAKNGIYEKMIKEEDCEQQRKELFQYLDQLMERANAGLKGYTDAFDALVEAYKSDNPNPPTPEQLAQLKENAYTAYCKAHDDHVLNYELAEVREKLRDPDYAQKMDSMLTLMFQNMEDLGAELQEAYTDLRQAQSQQLDQDQMREAEDRFLRLYHRAIVADLSKVSNDSHLNSRPKTFFETMGDVIENNVMASLFRLGRSANKYRKAMNNTI